MKYELKSIGYWSLIKISFLINLIVGFIVGLFFAVFVGAIISLAGRMSGMAGLPMFTDEMPPIGFLLVFYPFMFAFGGAVFNTIIYVIIAFIYNIMAKLIGGIELEFNEIRLQPVTYATLQPPQAPPAYAPPSTPPPPPPPVQPLPPNTTAPPEENKDKEEL